MVVPMLTEPEWARMEPVLRKVIADVKSYRTEKGVGLKEAMAQSYGENAIALYRELTGFPETNSDAIWHHRASMYGPPCQMCGKPLRTPQAKLCGSCSAERA
jgi:hypothetical protein